MLIDELMIQLAERGIRLTFGNASLSNQRDVSSDAWLVLSSVLRSNKRSKPTQLSRIRLFSIFPRSPPNNQLPRPLWIEHLSDVFWCDPNQTIID